MLRFQGSKRGGINQDPREEPVGLLCGHKARPGQVFSTTESQETDEVAQVDCQMRTRTFFHNGSNTVTSLTGTR